MATRSKLLAFVLCAAAVAVAVGGFSRKPAASDEALPPAASDEAQIRAAFEQYKAAALNSDGAAVVPLVTSESVAYYDRLRRLALTATEAELAEARYVERMQVWMFRQLLSAEELSAMSREELVAYVFDKHMMGEDLEKSSAIDTLQIERTTATARHLARGRPAGGPIREVTFRWEKGKDGQWRLDLLHAVALMELQLDDIHHMDPTKSKERLAQLIVQAFTRTELDPDHYEPMLAARQEKESEE